MDDDDEMIFRHITFDASSQVENYSHETRIFLTLTFTYISFSDADHGVETELLMESTSSSLVSLLHAHFLFFLPSRCGKLNQHQDVRNEDDEGEREIKRWKDETYYLTCYFSMQ